MNKEINKLEITNHNISLIERQNISITGVKKIQSFDNEEFLIETTLGPLGIKGQDLEIIKLDTHEGNVIIKGVIDGFTYLEATKDKKDPSLLSRLFK